MRGYMTHIYGGRGNVYPDDKTEQIGHYKDAMTVPGTWNLFVMMQGETIQKQTMYA